MTEVVVALLVALLAFELKAWYPSLLSQFVALASRRLPRRQRERYREEWSAHLCETPGAIVKLWQAIGFVWASGQMFPRWRRGIAHVRFVRRSEMAERMTLRALDLIFAVGALVYLAPIFLFVSVILKTNGPVFERRRSIGRNGVNFDELRFHVRESQESKNVWHSGFKVFIRRTSIDELPLIVNVLRSEMSFVGTSERLSCQILKKPGLTSSLSPVTSIDPRKAKSIAGRIALTAVVYVSILAVNLRAFFIDID